jgi:hypothetical protein
MEPILIKPDSSLLNEQYGFLIRREFFVRYNWFKKAGYYFLAWIILLIMFSFLTNSEALVVLKGVLLFTSALAVLASFIFSATILTRWIKRQNWKKARVKHIVESKLTYWLMFDENQISFSTEIHNSNIKWEYYKYYLVHKDSIYIFPESIYEAIVCSKIEIGEISFNRLKEIVAQKLKALNSKNGT